MKPVQLCFSSHHHLMPKTYLLGEGWNTVHTGYGDERDMEGQWGLKGKGNIKAGRF